MSPLKKALKSFHLIPAIVVKYLSLSFATYLTTFSSSSQFRFLFHLPIHINQIAWSMIQYWYAAIKSVLFFWKPALLRLKSCLCMSTSATAVVAGKASLSIYWTGQVPRGTNHWLGTLFVVLDALAVLLLWHSCQ